MVVRNKNKYESKPLISDPRERKIEEERSEDEDSEEGEEERDEEMESDEEDEQCRDLRKDYYAYNG